MQHGLIDSADTFVLNYKENSIAFIAAEKGYDIWMGNNRGNKYSKQHVKLDSKNDLEYWMHSFPDFGKYDLPAFLEHIKKTTHPKNKITYLGHSQGTTQMFYMMATNHSYIHDNINLFIGLGPFA